MDRITVLAFQGQRIRKHLGNDPPKFCNECWVTWREAYSITAMEATLLGWPVKIASGDHLRTATGLGIDGGICRFDFLTTAGVKAKAEILPFGFMQIVVGIVVEIFGYPELLSISIDDAIDSLVLALCDVFGLRGHRARPFVERGRFL